MPPGQPLWVGGSSSASGPYRDVYVMNADGSDQRNLTHTTEAEDYAAAYAPDGRSIAFAAYDGSSTRIFVINADGSGKRALTPEITETSMAWSPDGRKIAFFDAGISVVRWTYDPLLARNAHFNLQKLGANADGFERDFYGEMDDQLNRGDRSDRFTVRWELHPEESSPGEVSVRPVLRRSEEIPPRPERIGDPAEDGAGVSVAIPEDYPTLREEDPELSRSWRDATADAFEACLRAGMEAVRFERFSSTYIFAPAGEQRG